MTKVENHHSVNITHAKTYLNSFINALAPGQKLYITQKGKVVAFIQKTKNMEILS